MIQEKCTEAAIRVLHEEAEAILGLIPYIKENFAKACSLILDCKGKVILTGVGKSGHIGSKIASTLASTGTQSFFVQAGEAAHGDLGMIGQQDVVIAVSHSGEGNELKIMIPILRRRKIPLIAITGNETSTLAKASDICLLAKVKREACPLNLAPTSSSTAELALGDALAVALLEARGFTERDFAMSHPGGALGRRLLVRCGDIMHTNQSLPKVRETATIQETVMEMTQKGLGMVAIVDKDYKLVGIYTDGDLRRTFEAQVPIETEISKVMTKKYTKVTADTLAADAVAIMQQKKLNGFIVVDNENRAIGAFNTHDLLRAGII